MSQGGQLFRAQLAANFQLRLNSHTHLRCLGGCELVYSLFDEVLVGRFSVECLIERDVCFAQRRLVCWRSIFVSSKIMRILWRCSGVRRSCSIGIRACKWRWVLRR